MEIVWLESEGEFRGIAHEWDKALRKSGEDIPFLLSDFILTWWKYFSDGRSLRIFVVFEGKDIVGGLPLYLEKNRNSRVLRYPGSADFGVANYTNFLSVKPLDKTLDLFLRSLCNRNEWDLLQMEQLKVPFETWKNLEKTFDDYGFLLLKQSQLASLSIEVPESLDGFLMERSKNLRKKVRRSYRLAEDAGKLVLDKVRGSENVEDLFRLYVDLSKSSYAEREKESAFEDSRLRDFFGDLLKRFEESGFLDAYALKLNQDIIAIAFCYTLQNNLNYILTTFDYRFSELRPGHLLTSQLLRAAIQRKSPVMDFFTGEKMYKKLWTNRQDPIFKFTIGRNTFRNRAVRNKERLYRKLGSIHALKVVKSEVSKVMGHNN